MSILFAASKQVSEVRRENGVGRFSISSTPLSWIRCRDHFLNTFRADTPGIFMTICPDQLENVPSFVLKTEEILDIQSRGFMSSRFAKTNRSYVIWIDPSLFWRASEVKRSFFSALLRAGLEYIPEKNNYEEALYKKEYFRRTKAATVRFLFGHTESLPDQSVSSPRFRGWVSAFSKLDEQVVRKKLHSPDNCNGNTSLIGAGSLWRR
jgi:hypothetical protein